MQSKTLACLPVVVACAVGPSITAPAHGATVTRYVAETDSNYDYTFRFRPFGGLRVEVDKKSGALSFNRRGRGLVGAVMCDEAPEEGPFGGIEPPDISGRGAIKAEAESRKIRTQRVRGGVYRAGRQYWLAVRGGMCLRFAARTGTPARLARAVALRTTAQLGRVARTRKSPPEVLALVERTRQADYPRQLVTGTGGICAGLGIACRDIALPDSVKIELAGDEPARYVYVKFSMSLLGIDLTVEGIQRGDEAWLRQGDPCWSKVAPDEIAADSDDSARGGLPLRRWKLRYGKPVARPDGTTSISWRGYWDRGVAVIGSDGRVLELQAVERWDPDFAISLRYLATYPATITQVSPDPLC